MSFSTDSDPHQSMIWKGLIAVLGIIFFFFTERALTMIAEWRKKRQKEEKPSSRVRVMRDPESAQNNDKGVHDANEKLCKHKYSSYPYCYDEIALQTRDDHHHHQGNRENNKDEGNHSMQKPFSFVDPHDHGDNNETIENLLPNNYYNNSTTTPTGDGILDKDDPHHTDNNTISTNLDDGSIESSRAIAKGVETEENYTIILREHESKHHGHSHTHGHVHSPPSSLSSVAWMVVMGDGLHNFTDGMTIGAAFSSSIAGGFSTAIAVFCHELPHELGDFAVLLKAGMSARQAVYYNVLSSVLSFFGMVLGVMVGDRPEASAWIFACAAGLFLYIALVDMVSIDLYFQNSSILIAFFYFCRFLK